MALLEQAKFLGLIILVLAEIAITVAYLNHLVRFQSGVDNNETLRGVWSKAEQIIYQPTSLPLIISLITGVGFNILVHQLIFCFLRILDLATFPAPANSFWIMLISTAAGAVVAAVVHSINRGTLELAQLLGTLASFLVLTVVQLLGEPWLHDTSYPVGVIFAIWLVTVASVTVAATFALRRRIQIHAVAPLSGGPKPFALIAIAAGLLSVLRAEDVWLTLWSSPYHNYMAGALRQFLTLMVLINCSFVAILATNRSILTGTYHWQWRSIAVPTIPMILIESVVTIIISRRSKDGYGPALHTLSLIAGYFYRIFMYAASGYLGAAAYLAALSRIAASALAPGGEGEPELILDEEDSEYEA